MRYNRWSRQGIWRQIMASLAADVDLGNPVRLLLTPGQASEYSQAEALIEGLRPKLYWQTKVMTQTLS